MNISQNEYLTKYNEYLRRVNERHRREMLTLTSGNRMPFNYDVDLDDVDQKQLHTFSASKYKKYFIFQSMMTTTTTTTTTIMPKMGQWRWRLYNPMILLLGQRRSHCINVWKNNIYWLWFYWDPPSGYLKPLNNIIKYYNLYVLHTSILCFCTLFMMWWLNGLENGENSCSHNTFQTGLLLLDMSSDYTSGW